MGIFSTNNDLIDESFNDESIDELSENFLYDDISKLSDDLREEFIKEEGEVLIEAGRLGRRTLVRLSKQDDLTRRMKMAALQLSKNKNDPLFNQLVKNRIKERKLISKIMKKYNNKASRLAKAGQKKYMKVKNKIPIKFFK